MRWETNVSNGVCGLEFDRKDIQTNKARGRCAPDDTEAVARLGSDEMDAAAPLSTIVRGSVSGLISSRHGELNA
eukprot:6196764-Pleurochrysis_carterae.AAC.1